MVAQGKQLCLCKVIVPHCTYTKAVTRETELASPSGWLLTHKSPLGQFGGSGWLRANTIRSRLHLLTEEDPPQNLLWRPPSLTETRKSCPQGLGQEAWPGVPVATELPFHWNSLEVCHRWLISRKHDAPKRDSVSSGFDQTVNLIKPTPRISNSVTPTRSPALLSRCPLGADDPQENTHLASSHQPLSARTGKALQSSPLRARTPPPARWKGKNLHGNSKENKLRRLYMTNESKSHAMSS